MRLDGRGRRRRSSPRSTNRNGAFDVLELRSLFSGEYDEFDAIAEIHGGAGGTDAQDWAEMMLRMYLRWAERHGYEVEIDEVSPGRRRGRHPLRDLHRATRGATPTACSPPSGVSTASCGCRRSTPSTVARRASPPSRSLRCLDESRRHRRDRREGSAHRHLPLLGSGRPARQRHRLRDPSHPPADRRRRLVSERAQPAAEQGEGDAGSSAPKLGGAASAGGAQGASSSSGQFPRPAVRRRLGEPDPLLRDGAVPARRSDLRTGHETGNVDAVLDGDLDEFMSTFLRWRRAGDAPPRAEQVGPRRVRPVAGAVGSRRRDGSVLARKLLVAPSRRASTATGLGVSPSH